MIGLRTAATCLKIGDDHKLAKVSAEQASAAEFLSKDRLKKTERQAETVLTMIVEVI